MRSFGAGYRMISFGKERSIVAERMAEFIYKV